MSHNGNKVASDAARFGCMLAIVLIGIVGHRTAFAQSLNWEGQTGVFVTPLAYSVSTGDARLSLPVVSYHYLNAGPVLGSFHQVSIRANVWSERWPERNTGI